MIIARVITERVKRGYITIPPCSINIFISHPLSKPILIEKLWGLTPSSLFPHCYNRLVEISILKLLQ